MDEGEEGRKGIAKVRHKRKTERKEKGKQKRRSGGKGLRRGHEAKMRLTNA